MSYITLCGSASLIRNTVSLSRTATALADKYKLEGVVRGLSQSSKRYLTIDQIPQRILNCEYAVRGAIVQRALQIESELRNGTKKYPFSATLPANIGNPQAVGQPPITFHRQVLSALCFSNSTHASSPASQSLSGRFPADVSARADEYLKAFGGSVGAYSHSKGALGLRERVADWLTARDGAQTDPETVFLTDGASPGVRLGLELLIGSSRDGILIPIPQYPLYSATIAKLGGTGAHYFLNEESGWSLEVAELQSALERATNAGVDVKAMVLINPGNPTGAVLDRCTLEQVCRFCHKYELLLFADEVYQENIYEDVPFISCRKVAHELGLRDLQILSFHSCSKGLFGECGLRGGLMQAENIPHAILDQMYKLSSISLCANTLGQALMTSILNPPNSESDESYELYKNEVNEVYSALRRKADFVCQALRAMEGVTCQRVRGAMYAFPRIRLPRKAIAEAQAQGIQPDLLYCQEMLEQTGVVTVPGSGFGQADGSWHYRITILPREDKLASVFGAIEKFHQSFLGRYA